MRLLLRTRQLTQKFRGPELRPTVRFWLLWLSFSSFLIALGGLINIEWVRSEAYEWAFVHFPPYFWRGLIGVIGFLGIAAVFTRNLWLVRTVLASSLFVQLTFSFSILIVMFETDGGYLAGWLQWLGCAAIGVHLLSHSFKTPKSITTKSRFLRGAKRE